MIYDELVLEVEKLGYGDTIESESTLIDTLNIALKELYFYIPVINTAKIYARGYKPVGFYKEILYNGNAPVTINTDGKCFTMRVMGKGNYTIDNGTTVQAYQFDTGKESKIISGFISHGGYIRFWGGFSFTVYNLAIYDDLISNEVEDIPDGSGKVVYDVRKICSDFLAFASSPTDINGNAIENCLLRDGKIKIDSDFSVEITVTYRRTPKRIIGIKATDEKREFIDINEEYVPLLVNLTWYHYLYNTNYTKAMFYKEKFDNLLALLNENLKVYDTVYVDVNGWA